MYRRWKNAAAGRCAGHGARRRAVRGYAPQPAALGSGRLFGNAHDAEGAVAAVAGYYAACFDPFRVLKTKCSGLALCGALDLVREAGRLYEPEAVTPEIVRLGLVAQP